MATLDMQTNADAARTEVFATAPQQVSGGCGLPQANTGLSQILWIKTCCTHKQHKQRKYMRVRRSAAIIVVYNANAGK